MIARHSENRQGIVLVRLIELSIVSRRLTVEIDAVADQVQETRFRLVRHVTVGLHPGSNKLLRHGEIYSPNVAVEVEDQLVCRDYLIICTGRNYVAQVQAIGCRAGRGREIPEGRDPNRLPVELEVAVVRRPYLAEYVITTAGHGHCLSSPYKWIKWAVLLGAGRGYRSREGGGTARLPFGPAPFAGEGFAGH